MSTAENFIDLLELDSRWPREYQTMIAQVRKFVDQKVTPYMSKCHEEGLFLDSWIEELKKLGILDSYTSGELDPIAYGLICRELERGSSGLRSFVSVQASLVISSILNFGTEDQIEQWAHGLGSLDKIGCFALTEPDYGSNPSGMITKATPCDEGYILKGHKRWITNAPLADVAVVWAKLDGKVRGFLLETNLPGLEIKEMTGKWSFRSSSTGEIILNDVKVPKSALMDRSKSIGSALKSLNSARYGIAWGAIGAASAALEEAIDYLKNRPQFNGRPLTIHQLIQGKLANAASELSCMQALAKELGELATKGPLKPYQVSLGKMNNCRKALEITRVCRELLGANGVHGEYQIGRRMVDLETVITYEGTEHIHALIIGQHLTGEAAYN